MSTRRHQLAATRHRAPTPQVHVGATTAPAPEVVTKSNLTMIAGGALGGVLIFTGSPVTGGLIALGALVVGASMKD